jgi:hypothetical protein
MSAITDSKRARCEIAEWGYATPAACPHLRSPGHALLAGAWSMMDPFRSSLPSAYRYMPPVWADVIALRSDWGIYWMDFGHVRQHELVAADERQESLFDPNDLERLEHS